MILFDKEFIKAHTLAECLEEYDCSYATLRTWCVLHNCKYIKNKREKERKYHSEMTKYAGVVSDREAAEILGCSRLVVFNYRVEHNIAPHRKHKKLGLENIEEILNEYKELGTLQAVADKHNVTRECVRQWFDKAGYHYVKGVGYVK